MKTCVNGSTATRVLTAAVGGGEWLNLRPGRSIPWRKNLRYLLDRRLGGCQSRYRRSGEDRKFCPCQESNPESLVVQRP